VTGFELTAEERMKVQFTVDQLERLLPAVKASYDEMEPILERYQEHTWERPAATDEEANRVLEETGIRRLYDLSFQIVDLFEVLSGQVEVFGPEQAVEAGYVKAPAA
jgi:hypothetical protein